MTRLTIPLQSTELSTNPLTFRSAKEEYTIRLTRSEIEDLAVMLFICIEGQPAQDEMELEIFILEELRKSCSKKALLCGSKTSLKMLRSQTRTLFLWLNEADFAHPLHNNLARKLVEQIHKQMI